MIREDKETIMEDKETILEDKQLNHCTFDKCDYSSVDNSNFKRHISTVHEDKNNGDQCGYCKYSSNDQSNLMRHFKNRHRGKKPKIIAKKFKKNYCSICEIQYSCKKDFNEHKAFVHEGKKPKNYCPLCEIQLAHKQALNDHIANVHEGKELPSTTCSICDTTFDSGIPHKLWIQRPYELVYYK